MTALVKPASSVLTVKHESLLDKSQETPRQLEFYRRDLFERKQIKNNDKQAIRFNKKCVESGQLINKLRDWLSSETENGAIKQTITKTFYL